MRRSGPDNRGMQAAPFQPPSVTSNNIISTAVSVQRPSRGQVLVSHHDTNLTLPTPFVRTAYLCICTRFVLHVHDLAITSESVRDNSSRGFSLSDAHSFDHGSQRPPLFFCNARTRGIIYAQGSRLGHRITLHGAGWKVPVGPRVTGPSRGRASAYR